MERSCPIKMKPMKIHDKWYDMSDFDHPGGPIMLKLGESRDATALFESHHPFTSRKYLETILTKHEVKQDESCYLMDAKDKDDVFDWPEFESKNDSDAHAPVSEFAYELRTKVQNYFKSEAKRRGVPLIEATKGTPFRWVQITLMTMLFTSTLPGFLRGEWWTLFATPLTYWILGVNTFHDGSHFALSRDWRVNLVGTYVGWWFSSPFEWYHQHVIGHHAYPNMPNRDPDLYHNGTFERHTKTQRHKPLHRHQASTWPPIWFIGTLAMNYLKPIQMLTTGWYNRAVKMVQHTPARIQQHVAGRFFVFFLCHITPFLLHDSWFKAFLFSAIPVGLVSVCFMISSQVLRGASLRYFCSPFVRFSSGIMFTVNYILHRSIISPLRTLMSKTKIFTNTKSLQDIVLVDVIFSDGQTSFSQVCTRWK